MSAAYLGVRTGAEGVGARQNRTDDMSIDGCRYTFLELADTVLPGHMRRLRDALKNPYPAERFAKHGVGVKSVLRELNREMDFPGCYVFLDKTAPVYVGISRQVVRRVLWQLKGDGSSASLACRIAIKKSGGSQRAGAMSRPEFPEHFKRAQDYLKDLSAAFIEIENDVEMCAFELYAAMELNTSAWNTFRTH